MDFGPWFDDDKIVGNVFIGVILGGCESRRDDVVGGTLRSRLEAKPGAGTMEYWNNGTMGKNNLRGEPFLLCLSVDSLFHPSSIPTFLRRNLASCAPNAIHYAPCDNSSHIPHH